MTHFVSPRAAHSTLLVSASLLLGGCFEIFDRNDEGEAVGEPRRGEDVDNEIGDGDAAEPWTGGTGPGSGGAGTDGDGAGGGVVSQSGGASSGGLGSGATLGAGGSPSDGGSSSDGGSGAMPGIGGSNSGLADWQQAALDTHNEVRELHCVPEMTWNADAAAFAQEWAEGLCPTMNLNHSMGSGFGENLYMSWGTGGGADLVGSAEAAVEGWYSEIEDYNYGNPGFASGTGHFTQVVWEGSTAVGCGIATCTVSQWNVVVVSCNYSPPGNYTNQFEENVPPLCQ